MRSLQCTRLCSFLGFNYFSSRTPKAHTGLGSQIPFTYWVLNKSLHKLLLRAATEILVYDYRSDNCGRESTKIGCAYPRKTE